MILTLIFLCSLLNSGDVGQRDALVQAFAATGQQCCIHTIDANAAPEKIIEAYQQAESTIEAGNNRFVFALGEKSLPRLKLLQEQGLALHNVVVSVHQWFDLIEELKVDWLAIPTAAAKVSCEFQAYAAREGKKAKPIYMFAVPTVLLTKDEIINYLFVQHDCDKSFRKYLDKEKIGILVILPGDAVDGKEIKLFSKESALRLAFAVYHLWYDIYESNKEWYNNNWTKLPEIIIQASPRTGKHDSSGKEIVPSPHIKKWGVEEDPELDEVSRYFCSILKEKELPFRCFNFFFYENEDGTDGKSNSMLNPFLFLASSTIKHRFIVPSESISMIGQIPYYLQASQIIYFEPSSMNSSHKAILGEALERKYGCSFAPDLKSVIVPEGIAVSSARPARQENDADLIVCEVLEVVKGY